MKFTVTFMFLVTALNAVIATPVDDNANYKAAMSLTVLVDAMTASTATSVSAIGASLISSFPAKDIVAVHIATSTTVPCTENKQSAVNSTTTVISHVFKTTTDLITIGGINSFSSILSIQIPSSVVTSISTLTPQSTVSVPATSIFVTLVSTPSVSTSASPPLSESHVPTTATNIPDTASIAPLSQSAVTNPLTETAIDVVRASTSTFSSSVIVFKATTALPTQYLSTFTSGSSTITVTMTSTSTSTRIISVMMNGGYVSAVPFLPYQSSTLSQLTVAGHLSPTSTHSQSQSVVQPHVAIATTSQSENCAPATVYITITGSVAGTSTVLASANSAGYSGTAVGSVAVSGPPPQSASISKPTVTSTAASAAVYGTFSTADRSTGSNSAVKLSTTPTSTSVSGTGTSIGNQTAPSMSPFLTPNNSSDTANSNAGDASNGMPLATTVLAVFLMAASSMFVLAL